jgi:hypothetical protein
MLSERYSPHRGRVLRLDFSAEAYKDLEELQARINAKSKAEVFRIALGLLNWLAAAGVPDTH